MAGGGISKALRCLQVFLPEIEWQPFETRRAYLFQRAPVLELPVTLQPLETLIGYSFEKKALLVEAMTHASYRGGSQSLERLEFLGDAVLDYIVVKAMYEVTELSHIQMHHLRTSLVNADYLAFICMEWSFEQDLIELEPDPSILDAKGLPTFKKIAKKKNFPLWRFLRHMSPRLGAAQVATSDRHAALRGAINEAFERGMHYPWALLAGLKAHKFFSDMVESLLGAIWIDSGSFETCTAIVERMGILRYFRRILQDGVETLHPKEELGMLADTESVHYVISSRLGEMDGTKEYLCSVFVGDVHVTEVDGGVSSEEVKTKVAERAVKVLKSRKERSLGMEVEKSVEGQAIMDIEMKD
jgi:dsRNA-specific ribonuclease